MNENEIIANDLLVKVFNHILQIEDKILKNGEFKDLSVREMHVLESISKVDNSTMSEVSKDLYITVGTLTIAIDRLIKKGYVLRKRIEEDRRVVIIELTEKGVNANKEHNDFHEEMISSMFYGIEDSEQKILTLGLEKLNKYFDEKNEILKRT